MAIKIEDDEQGTKGFREKGKEFLGSRTILGALFFGIGFGSNGGLNSLGYLGLSPLHELRSELHKDLDRLEHATDARLDELTERLVRVETQVNPPSSAWNIGKMYSLTQ